VKANVTPGDAIRNAFGNSKELPHCRQVVWRRDALSLGCKGGDACTKTQSLRPRLTLQPCHRSEPSRWSNLTPRGLSVLLVGLQLLGLVHLTLERHGVCWEHGTLTELGGGGVAALPGAALGAPEEDSTSRLSGLHRGGATRLEDADGDRHCPVQASRRNWASSPPPTELVVDVAPNLKLRDFADSTARVDDALLLRAPKQSPPSNA
jgi:hypothetical protein